MKTTSTFIWVMATAVLAGCGTGTDGEEAGHGEEGEHEHGEEGHAEEVTLTEEALARSRVEVGRVERRVVFGGAWIPAEVRLDPSRTASVAPLVPGRVVSVEVHVGDRVTAGQPLAVIASAEVGQARASQAQARARVEAARLARDRADQLFREGIGSQRALVEAESALRQAQAEASGFAGAVRVYGGARASGAEVVLSAPIDGVVVEQRATVGETTDPDRPPFVISDPSRVWIVGNVPELDVDRVHVGSPATLRLGAYPDASWPVVIEFVAPALDEQSRTLPVRATLENADGRLRAGFFGRLEIAGGDSQGVLAVPVGALARVGGEDVVFVPADEPRTFRPVPVRLGQRDAAYVEIAEGLEDGAEVVVNGAFTLRSELQRGELSEGHSH